MKEELISPVCAEHNATVEMWKELIRCMKKGFDDAIAKAKKEPELIPATPELLELAEFLANAKKNSKEKSYREKFNELARPAMRWYPSWSAFYAATKPTSSHCRRCGDPLFGLATALCDECFDEQQKEKKDCDFRFSEWD